MKEKKNGSLFEATQQKGSKQSVFLMFINRITAFIYSLFLYSGLGRCVARDSEKQGWLHALDRKIEDVYKNKFSENPLKPLHVLFDNRATRTIGRIGSFFATLALPVYGTLFVMLGIGSIVIYYLNYFLEWGRDFDEGRLIASIIITVAACPFILSSHNPLSLVRRGGLARLVFIRYLAIPEERFENDKKRRGGLYIGLALLLGLILGAATYYIHPLHLMLAFVIVAAIAIIMTNPESGLMITIPATPFLQYSEYSSQILLLLIIITGISFAFKCFRRQRHIMSTRAMWTVLLFCGLLIFKSMFFGGENIRDALYVVIYIAGAYLLSSNLIRSEKMADHAVRVLYASMVAICFIAVGDIVIDTISRIMSYNISSTVGGELMQISLSLADSSDVFGILAAMLMPIFFARAIMHKSITTTTIRMLAFALLLVCTFFFGSFEASLCVLFVMMVYILIRSHKSVGMIIAIALPLLIVAVSFPIIRYYTGINDPIVYLENIFPQINASASYAAETVRGVITMLMQDGNWFGIGISESAFVHAFAPYSNAVTSGARDASNLYLQIACWSGISGLLVFAWSIFLHIKRCVGYMIRTTNYPLRNRLAGMLCALLSVLLLGNFSFVWQDARMLYMFWLIVGILGFYIREGIAEEHTVNGNMPGSATSCDVTAKI